MLGIIVFFHILGAIIWIGGMITMRFAIHPSLQECGDNRLPFVISALKNSFVLFVVAAIIMGASGMYLMTAFGALNPIAHIKSSIWLAMAMVLGFAIFKYIKAKEAFEQNNKSKAKESFEFIANKLIPVNILLGILELSMGVILRGV